MSNSKIDIFDAKVQLCIVCIVYIVRNSMKYVSWKDRKLLAADLRKMYSAQAVDDAETVLTCFGNKWND